MESTYNPKELDNYLESIKKVEGKDMYDEIIQQKLLCGLTQWVRVLREVTELNKEFHTLRTYMAAVSDIVGVLHFLIYPADGAFADKPLCGRVLIPATYPQNPPVVHLLTKTGRGNVDVYSCYTDKKMLKYMHSSMCFDVLRSEANGGKWKSNFTISCLMASLIQSIVSMKVPQEYGGELEEYVTMEKLEFTNKAVKTALTEFGKVMPPQQTIKKIQASPVETQHFKFPKSFESLKHDAFVTVESQGIYLQVADELKSQNVFSIGLDLTDLQSNPNTVFSIVLTNDPSDMMGKKNATIIVRNGVTATAAKKKKNGTLNWFYHGKPMNQSNLKLIVTVGYDQFCISYLDGDKKIVHGDCPVSFLTRAEIGFVQKEKFYLCILMKNKGSGKQVKVNTFLPEYGYLHPIYAGVVEELPLVIDQGEEIVQQKPKEEETKEDKKTPQEDKKTQDVKEEGKNPEEKKPEEEGPKVALPRTKLKLSSKSFQI